MGAFANQVVVQQVQSLAGNHVLVPAPELRVTSSIWNINGTASLITGITLNLTTIGATGATGNKLYKVYVQVSCFNNATRTEFTCATGSNTIILPVNMNGTSTRLNVPITPPIDPETIELHDLSFIVTGSPANCTPSFTFTASPTVLTLSRNGTTGPTQGTVIKTLTSTCGFSGPVIVLVSQGVGSLLTALSPGGVTLTPGGTATVTESISTTSAIAPGTYTITNTACATTGPPQCPSILDGPLQKNVIITINVT